MNATDLAAGFTLRVDGRPAPQGSKKHGAHGQMRESSPYLAAWRAAVKTAVYRAYAIGGIESADLPLFRGPVAVGVVFRMPTDRRIDSAPDYDKLLRATWDALTEARVWEDDGRVVDILAPSGKRHVREGETSGADITVRPAVPA